MGKRRSNARCSSTKKTSECVNENKDSLQSQSIVELNDEDGVEVHSPEVSNETVELREVEASNEGQEQQKKETATTTVHVADSVLNDNCQDSFASSTAADAACVEEKLLTDTVQDTKEDNQTSSKQETEESDERGSPGMNDIASENFVNSDNFADKDSTGIKRGHPDDMDNTDAMKKSKHDNQTPSKVIHIRQLPADVTEAEIKALGLPFGRVTNTLLMRTKSQAFLELQDVDSAKTMINYYHYCPPTVRNQPVFLQFSQHQELHTNNQQNNQSNGQTNGDDRENSDRSNTTVLKVIVTNIVYPVTIEVLQQVFQRCGEIQKIVTFLRNDQYHALIQYSCVKEAASAKSLFDHQNIYNGCNTLHVEFSKMTELTVKYNNDKMRDFTKPDRQNFDQMNAQLQAMQAQMNPGMLPLPTQFPPQHMFAQGFGMNGGGFPPNMMGNMSPNHQHNYQTPMGMQGGGMQHRHGSVLLVSNLVEGQIKCEDLFILFGHYGDVQRVKILYNKKDTALIQFADASQASTALQNLNNATLYGQEMRVSRSKHDTVNMPKSEDEGKELTKDYANSPLHRFKKPGSKNFQNIFPPIRTLHLSNIPESVTEEELQEMFTEHGAISNFRFFPKDRRMALIQLGTVEEAILSLIKLHNNKMNETSHLRVSFAKNEMQE